MLNILSICFGIIGIVGTLFSIYSFIKNYKVKKLKAIIDSTILISDKINEYENLKIAYNKENINSFIKTHIKIENVGTDIIEPSDLTHSSPISISPIDNFLFDDISQLEITASNSNNKVSLIREENNSPSLKVDFEFLNPKDEINIVLFHSGSITVNGDLKGKPITVDIIKSYEYNEESYVLESNKKRLLITKRSVITFLLIAAVFFLSIASIIDYESSIMSMFLITLFSTLPDLFE